jgi:fumarate reductase subunit C
MELFDINLPYITIGIFAVIFVVWFYAILYTGKRCIGKRPCGWKATLFLLLSGPIGWCLLIVALILDIFEKISKKTVDK